MFAQPNATDTDLTIKILEKIHNKRSLAARTKRRNKTNRNNFVFTFILFSIFTYHLDFNLISLNTTEQ